MKTLNKMHALTAAFLALTVANTAGAGEVKILAADLKGSGNNLWSVNVTLKHGDTGWGHYADSWRVVDGEGKLLDERVLAHPHVSEQPFTRGLTSVKIPQVVTTVYIEAHDKVHGWTAERLMVELSQASGGVLRVEAE